VYSLLPDTYALSVDSKAPFTMIDPPPHLPVASVNEDVACIQVVEPLLKEN
jgi:hypothetical protein